MAEISKESSSHLTSIVSPQTAKAETQKYRKGVNEETKTSCSRHPDTIPVSSFYHPSSRSSVLSCS